MKHTFRITMGHPANVNTVDVFHLVITPTKVVEF